MRIAVLAHDAERGWTGTLPEPGEPGQTAVFAFGASGPYAADPGPLRELSKELGDVAMIGCSTAGEIHGSAVRDGSLSVAVARFDRTRVHTAYARCADSPQSHDAGRELAEALLGPGLAGVFVLSDGLSVNGSDLVRGLTGALPGIPVTGGLAGDGDRFEATWVLVDGEPADGYVSALGFYGDAVRLTSGSEGGWDLFGPQRLITRSEGHVLYELDGRPALSLYKEYLGDLAAGLPATGLLFPLGLAAGDDEPLTVRTILAVDEEHQALVFAGDMPTGARAQLMQATTDRLVTGADVAAMHARPEAGPALAVAISCVGRRLVLSERTEEETEATLHRMPAGTHQVGFYSYGEIAPHRGGPCDLHNQTMTLTVITEDT
ncbi:MAG: FIST C-terminal domain-containing protein [Actinobacteria bacterium]|nr:FIST C-terminal domain-containing protein [Actinomycetota bacterium]